MCHLDISIKMYFQQTCTLVKLLNLLPLVKNFPVAR